MATLIDFITNVYGGSANIINYTNDSDYAVMPESYQVVQLGKPNCNSTSGTLGSVTEFYNCNLCGNDKPYCQPLLKNDFISFAFSEKDTISTDVKNPIADYGGDYGGTKLFLATLVLCDDDSVTMEVHDQFAGGQFVAQAYAAYDCNTNNSFQMFRVGVNEIVSAFLYDNNACCFYIKFEFFNVEGVVIKTMYSEQYCLSNCYDIAPKTAIMNTCCMSFTGLEVGSHTMTLILGNGVTLTKTYSIDGSLDDLIQQWNLDYDIAKYGYFYKGTGTQICYVSFETVVGFGFDGLNITNPGINPTGWGLGCAPNSFVSAKLCCFTLPFGMLFPQIFDFDVSFSNGDEIHTSLIALDDYDAMIAYIKSVFVGVGGCQHITSVGNKICCLFIDTDGFIFQEVGVAIEIVDSLSDTYDFTFSGSGCPAVVNTNTAELCYDCYDTVVLKALYSDSDCFNNHYKKPSEYCDGGTKYLGDDLAFELSVRLKGKVTLIGHTLEKTSNEYGVVTKTKKWFNYELLGSPIPEYVSSQLALVCAAPQIDVAGIPMYLDQPAITKDIRYSNMWRLFVKFKSEVCEMKFNC